MKVYIAIEADCIHGVFKDKNKAQKFIKKHKREGEFWRIDLHEVE